MSTVTIKDKTFRTFIPEEEIQQRVKAVAEKINNDLADKNPLFIAVLNGSFVFAADLIRNITIPCEISFVKLASYQGTTSTGKIKEVIGLNEDIAGRTVVILEDDLRKIKRYPDMNIWVNAELISWEHHQQVEEHHPQYHAKLLREIAKILKETRLRCEFIYYTGDGKFLILSPRVTDEMYKELDEQAYIALQKLDTGIPLMLKVATQRVNLQNCEKFSDLDKLFKHLERGLETDIIVEYLKDDQND